MSVHKRFLKIAPGLCLSIALLSSLALPPSLSAQSYVLVDLTAETGEDSGGARDVNADHLVVGNRGTCPARWERNAGAWNETLLPPCGTTAAMAVNNSGTAVGWEWQVNAPAYPKIWEEDEVEWAPIPGAQFTDINNSGQIVGGPLYGSVPALIWEDGEVTYLEGYAALGINDLGQVVGYAGSSPPHTATLWENIDGQWELTELGTLGGSSGKAGDINEESQIVGSAQISGGLGRAFLWEDGVMTELGTLGGSASGASGINNLGQVAGRAMTAEEEWHAFIWQDGVMSDLNDLIVSETELVLTTARAINDGGTIVGSGRTPDDQYHAFFARPLRVGDINLDAFVDAADLASLLGSWGPCADCANCPADLDNDCTVGALDLAILLGNWG